VFYFFILQIILSAQCIFFRSIQREVNISSILRFLIMSVVILEYVQLLSYVQKICISEVINLFLM